MRNTSPLARSLGATLNAWRVCEQRSSGGGAHRARHGLDFRTFQIDSKDLPSGGWQAERAGVAAVLRRGQPMSERVEERQSRTSDIAWVAFYSIRGLLLMFLWVYVPA